MYQYQYLEAHKTLIIRHTGIFVGAEIFSALENALVDIGEKGLGYIVVDATYVTAVTMEDSDSARVMAFTYALKKPNIAQTGAAEVICVKPVLPDTAETLMARLKLVLAHTGATELMQSLVWVDSLTAAFALVGDLTPENIDAGLWVSEISGF